MNKKEKKIVQLLAIILIIVDQITKIIFININKEFTLFGKITLGLENVQRDSLSDNISYILVSIIAITAIIRYISSKNTFIKTDSRIILTFAMAGAIGNVIDRIWTGHVINYIKIAGFTSINLAYIYIIITWIGMAGILTKYTYNNKIKGKKEDGYKTTNSRK